MAAWVGTSANAASAIGRNAHLRVLASYSASVKFYFGNTPHPAISQTYGNFVTNKKTNGFAKSAGEACNHVLLSALLQLQSQAKSLGGNGVVNIHSYFKKNEASHDQQVGCYKGFLMAGVALKGRGQSRGSLTNRSEEGCCWREGAERGLPRNASGSAAQATADRGHRLDWMAFSGI